MWFTSCVGGWELEFVSKWVNRIRFKLYILSKYRLDFLFYFFFWRRRWFVHWGNIFKWPKLIVLSGGWIRPLNMSFGVEWCVFKECDIHGVVTFLVWGIDKKDTLHGFWVKFLHYSWWIWTKVEQPKILKGQRRDDLRLRIGLCEDLWRSLKVKNL